MQEQQARGSLHIRAGFAELDQLLQPLLLPFSLLPHCVQTTGQIRVGAALHSTRCTRQVPPRQETSCGPIFEAYESPRHTSITVQAL